jgi:hypothetical protein
MTTVHLTLELADEIAENALSLGLLDSANVAQLLEAEVERRTQVPVVKEMCRPDFINWLKSSPLPISWGDLPDEQDAAEYIHNERRRTATELEE